MVVSGLFSNFLNMAHLGRSLDVNVPPVTATAEPETIVRRGSGQPLPIRGSTRAFRAEIWNLRRMVTPSKFEFVVAAVVALDKEGTGIEGLCRTAYVR